MNKRTTLALAMAVTIATPPLAAQNIVVSSSPYETFVTEVSRDLDMQVERIRPAPGWEPSGIAQVRFRTGSDGRAHVISTYRKSGDGRLDHEAIRAVERLTSLASVPEQVKPGRMVQVNIIVASTRSQFDRLSKRLARDEAERIASSPREKAVLALTMAPHPRS
jgi:hypothetical protein